MSLPTEPLGVSREDHVVGKGDDRGHLGQEVDSVAHQGAVPLGRHDERGILGRGKGSLKRYFIKITHLLFLGPFLVR